MPVRLQNFNADTGIFFIDGILIDYAAKVMFRQIFKWHRKVLRG